MNLRLATVEDSFLIAEVHVASWRSAYRRDLPQAYLDQLSVVKRESNWRAQLEAASSSIVVAEVDRAIVGFIVTSASRDEDATPSTGEIPALYLREEAWGSGVGRALMQEAELRLQLEGYTVATLWVLDSNARARKFYERSGWSVDGSSKMAEIGGVAVREVRYRSHWPDRTAP